MFIYKVKRYTKEGIINTEVSSKVSPYWLSITLHSNMYFNAMIA